MKDDLQKATSKTGQLNSMILRGWRERWTESQYSTQIKTVLPRGVSGDAYNLGDCILQQALIGSNANPLLLNYLKHSICAHLVSYAAVLEGISKYEHFDRTYCVCSLVEFLGSILDGVTCRSKCEENLLPGAMISLVHWLMQIFAMLLKLNGDLTTAQLSLFEHCCTAMEKINQNQFLLGILYVGRQEQSETFQRIGKRYASIKASLTSCATVPGHPLLEQYLHRLAFIDVCHLDMPQLQSRKVETITYCVQPILAVEVLLNPCNDTAYYVTELQMLQRLKHFSNTRLFYEIIRAGFISLSNVVETSHDTMWGAFTFFKVPHIIKQLHALSRSPGEQTPKDHIPEVVEAIEMLIEDNLLLDFMDTKCSCNIIEYLLNDWTKQHLVNEVHVKHFAALRENASAQLQKRDAANQAPSIINFIIRAEVPLSGILKTLSTDYNKVQEPLLCVLCQVLVGNSFDLILSVATVEGRLKTFVARLIQCNENSKQVVGEVGKSSVTRATLFDVSFLMLTFIVQTYGADAALPEKSGDSFFEKWVREFMVERNRPRNARALVSLCDEAIVDELLLTLLKPEGQFKNSLTWQDICMNLPGVLSHVLIAWEHEAISSADVKGILDNIKRRLFCFSVCAASYLCNYMYSVRESEFLKPLNMIQQFLTPPSSSDEMSTQDNVEERLGLSFQIIRKMQHDLPPPGNPQSRNCSQFPSNAALPSPLIDQFKDVWRTISEQRWLSVRATQVLKSLLEAGSAEWLTRHLVEEIVRCKYTKDMDKTMDIVFAILHLDIEQCTSALLQHILPFMVDQRQGEDINEPQTLVLARLCVYCIISSLETGQNGASSAAKKKRLRSQDAEEKDFTANTAKMRKLAVGEGGGDNSCSAADFISDSSFLSSVPNEPKSQPALPEPLNSSLQYIFKQFQRFVLTEELSPKIYFVFQFVSLLVECGGERVRPVLKLLPPNLVQNLLKVLLTQDLSVGFIARIYDLRVATARQAAVSDLCLWRNLQLKKESVVL